MAGLFDSVGLSACLSCLGLVLSSCITGCLFWLVSSLGSVKRLAGRLACLGWLTWTVQQSRLSGCLFCQAVFGRIPILVGCVD